MFGIPPFPANRRALIARRSLSTQSTRRLRRRRTWSIEALEDRTLLSTFTVNSLGDTGTGTGTSGDLRYCITQADGTTGNNTINFSVTGTITLNSQLPDLSNTTGLTDIEGPGAANLTVARSGATGTPDFGIFVVDYAATVKLVGLTITGGFVSGFDGGGGIFIYNGGTVTVTNSTIAGNSTTDFQGGGISNGGTLTITNSTISDNSAPNGNGGGIAGGTLTITNSTISDNSAGFAGGGIHTGASSTLTVTNSTIAGNNVAEGLLGGGLEVAIGTTATLYNTIVALNTSGSGHDALANDIALTGGTVSTSSAYNLIGTGGSGGLVSGVNGNQVGIANPGLGTLAENGGPTQTIAPGSLHFKLYRR
jgi:hypothetical protein